MTNEIVLSVNNLTYVYKDEWTRKTKTAVNEISFEVKRGEAFGFLGHNGSGKTTTIKNILGFVKIQQGDISLFGMSSSDSKSRKLLGYVPENPYFYEHLTVGELLKFHALLAGVPKSIIPEKIHRALKNVCFSGSTTLRLKALSKGLLQKVAIAQSIIHEPELLILDEPFSGLDPVGRREIRAMLQQFVDDGKTILISSHVLADVEALCDRAAIMFGGKVRDILDIKGSRFSLKSKWEVVASSLPEVVYSKISPQDAKVTVRGNEVTTIWEEWETARDFVRMLFAENYSVISFSPVQTSLEDVFIEYFEQSEAGRAL